MVTTTTTGTEKKGTQPFDAFGARRDRRRLGHSPQPPPPKKTINKTRKHITLVPRHYHTNPSAAAAVICPFTSRLTTVHAMLGLSPDRLRAHTRFNHQGQRNDKTKKLIIACSFPDNLKHLQTDEENKKKKIPTYLALQRLAISPPSEATLNLRTIKDLKASPSLALRNDR